MHDENQLLKSCIKLRYRFWCVCHKVRDVETPNRQVHNFMYRHHISKVQVSSFGGVRVFVKFAFKNVIFSIDVWYLQTVEKSLSLK